MTVNQTLIRAFRHKYVPYISLCTAVLFLFRFVAPSSSLPGLDAPLLHTQVSFCGVTSSSSLMGLAAAVTWVSYKYKPT